MSTYKTVAAYALTGGREFLIPFEYLARKFVVVTLIGPGKRKELILNTDYRFSTKSMVSTNVSWPLGEYSQIEIRRFTSATDRLVNFNDGSILRAGDLNLSQIQSLHVSEEARDLTVDLIGLDSDGNFDAKDHRIVNLADAVGPQEAVTLKQATQYAGSAGLSATIALDAATRAVSARDVAESSSISAVAASATAVNSAVAAKLSEKACLDVRDQMTATWFYPAKSFVAGLTVSDTKYTVLYDGLVYSASPNYTPFTTTSTFNPAQWLVFSNLTKEELSRQTGSSLIGHTGGTTVVAALASKVESVENIAALRSKSPEVTTQQIDLKCHTTPSIGGGGLFIWDPLSTDADDNGFIIKPSAVNMGRWVRKDVMSYLHPQMFGALGGAVDDTESLQKMFIRSSLSNIGMEFTMMHRSSSSIVYYGSNAFITARPKSGIVFSDISQNGVVVCSSAGQSAEDCLIEKIVTSGGNAGIKVMALAGSGASVAQGVYKKVVIRDCSVNKTGSGAIWVYHGDNVKVHGNSIKEGGDNSVYVEFSRHVVIHDNVSINAKGSGAFVAGYSDNVVAAEDIHIYSNQSYYDSEATSGSGTGSGVVLVHCKNSSAHDNSVDCANPNGTSSSFGILVDENTVVNVEVYNNTVRGAREASIASGTVAFYGRDISIFSNTLSDCRNGVDIRFGNGVRVFDNNIKRTGQSGIIASASAKNVDILANRLVDVGIQSEWSSYSAVDSAAYHTRVEDNDFTDSQSFSKFTSTMTLPSVSVSGVLAGKVTISMFESGVNVRKIDVTLGITTWNNLRDLVMQTAGWGLTVPGELYDIPIPSLRRSGRRADASVLTYFISEFLLTTAEPNGYVTLAASAGKSTCLRNKFTSNMFNSTMTYRFDLNRLFKLQTDTVTDVSEGGGGRTFRAAATPTTSGLRYAEGDRFIRNPPAVGQPKSWVATASGIDVAAVWASEGNL